MAISMTGSAIMLAAAIVVPQFDVITVALIHNPNVVRAKSDPPKILQAKVDVLIKPNGSAVRCNFVPGSGDEAAAKAACSDYRTVVIASPHPSLDGVPSYAVVRASARYANDASLSALPAEPDAFLAVNRLPQAKAFIDVTVLLAVDSTGKTIACEPAANAGRTPMVTAACSATGMLDAGVALDQSKRPIAYVTKRNVRLLATTPG
jgi:hypothetical protein